MAFAVASLEKRLAVGRVALGAIELARLALLGDAIPLDIAQVRPRRGHSLGTDADQARLHHRAPRAHAAEPIAARQQPYHAGAAADPTAVEAPAPDRALLRRPDRRTTPAPEIATRPLSALLDRTSDAWGKKDA